MIKLMLLMAVVATLGCDARSTNPHRDETSGWVKVGCPKCDGYGSIYIDEKHPLHEAGYPVGWTTCDWCNGAGRMLKNNHGVYAPTRQ